MNRKFHFTSSHVALALTVIVATPGAAVASERAATAGDNAAAVATAPAADPPATDGAAAAPPETAQAASPRVIGAGRVPEMRADAEIIVTGSRLRGTPLDSALPVDVISANDLRLSGQNNLNDLFKSLPYVTGSLVGSNNPTQIPRGEGINSVSLRGLGATSDILTLVLLNGQRIAQIERGIRPMLDVAALPMAAIGRIEVLKDGGAVTYGSDAVAGVINFVTYKSFSGLDVGADYSRVRDSDGDFNAHVTWGASNHHGSNILVSAEVQHISALAAADRDFTKALFTVNPNAFATSNPGAYSLNNAVGRNPATSFLDSGCTGLGGIVVTLSGRTTGPGCETQISQFQNLVDEVNRYKGYIEVNHDFGGVDLHVDAFYNRTNVPDVEGQPSPSALGSSAPTTATTGTGPGVRAGFYFVPASSPGLVALLGAGCSNAGALGLTAAQCAFAATNGINIPTQSAFRVYGLGGNLADGGGPALNSRHYDEGRVSGTLKGKIGSGAGVDWNANVTYGETRSASEAQAILVQRFQLALRGLGGPNCNTSVAANAGNAAAGCFYWNPFSNAFATNMITGAANPGYVPSAANMRELANWFTIPNETVGHDSILTGEVGLSGKGFELPGGTMQWAAGAQYRDQKSSYGGPDIGNLALNPCAEPGSTSCLPAVTGTLADGGASYPLSYKSKTYAVFTEFSLPLFRGFNAQVAARYEHGPAGGTTNPKVAAKWQLAPWIALRGSFETTFRAPASWQADPSSLLQSTLFGQGNQGTNLLYNVYGNADLKPESAKNYDIGIIFTPNRNVNLRVDAWQYDFRNQFAQMNGNTLVATMFPKTNGVASNANCGAAAFAGLQSRFVFNASGCGYANIQSVTGMVINQSPIRVNGVDIVGDLTFDVGQAHFRSSINATYTHQFKLDPVFTEGVQTAAGYDASGYLNFSSGGPLPRWKVQWSNNLNIGPSNLRVDMRYASSIIDQRCNSTITGIVNPAGQDICAANYVAVGYTANTGFRIPATFFVDFSYNHRFNDHLDATFTISNVLNRDPPFVRTDLSYDPSLGSALGRVFRLALHARL